MSAALYELYSDHNAGGVNGQGEVDCALETSKHSAPWIDRRWALQELTDRFLLIS